MKMPRAWVVTAAAMIGWLAIFRPWTIRPIAGEPRGPFDATEYVANMWDTRALPSLGSRAVGFTGFRDQHMDRATAVSLDGVVVQVDTSTRVGTAAVDVAPGDGRADALLMIGPVLRGTALRDALGIQFADFTNQIQFASVASALNDRVLATALKDMDAAARSQLKGRPVQVLGVAWRESGAPDALPLVVPARISIGARP